MADRHPGHGLPPRSRVLVTGAAGFIGSHLVDALLADGHQVVGLDLRTPDGHPPAGPAAPPARPGYTPLRSDITTDDLAPAVEGCDTVFHLAAIPGVRPSWDSFRRYAETNVVGTQRVAEACLAGAVRRLVYASSSSVYGLVGGPSREDQATAPASPYGVSKLAGEQLCHAYAARPGHPTTVVALRYFTVYGPRQRPDMAIGRLLTAAATGEPFPLYGDGSHRRDFTFVSDVVAATVAAASADLTAGGPAARSAPGGGPPRSVTVNVGGGASVPMTEVVDLVERVTGRPVRLDRLPERDGDVPATAADLTVAARVLGYRPRVGLAEGMARHARWLRRVESTAALSGTR
ncbi:hypothetical protein AWW66_00575 [Micromonospora rosaria]|uniref:NAD-dependent epimerase/dehydratase domain-containing protein n=1 Tax=Micromonospora rosaria TaxID=47874 RepID=A0A136PZW0_9ACTN|nr:NAD-dependent epimerase/dehydratase family protein [Micromonospora rosaria]KXK63972.1 hypothetical protein AWW66_00575 [Micromonospora rosaria]